MKRFLIYGLVGPPLGDITIFAAMMPLLQYAIGSHDPQPGIVQTATVIAIMLPFSYLSGVVPALLAGGADFLLARRGMAFRWRLPVMFVAGFAFAFVPLLSSMMAGYLPGPGRWLFGFVGAVPAAVCCFLSRDATKTA